jgi:hypothetical protein
LRIKQFAFMLFSDPLKEGDDAMERELYGEACSTLARIPQIIHTGQTYTDHDVVKVLLWASVHDRTVTWACQHKHWPLGLRRKKLISQPQMSRRGRTFSVQQVLLQLQHALRDRLPSGLTKYIDGKPLPVGGCSKDRDAKFGRGAGSIQRGYKMVCLVDQHGPIDAWRLGSMNVPEHEQARTLLAQMGQADYIVGDNAYDKNDLYDQAGSRNMQLVGQFKRSARAVGHRRHSVHRLQGLALQQQPLGQQLLRMRTGIERSYGNMTCFAGGLGPLPAWVRRPHRVALWIETKIILDYARRILLTKRLTMAHA